jgi:hypothetical protein
MRDWFWARLAADNATERISVEHQEFNRTFMSQVVVVGSVRRNGSSVSICV